MFEDLKDWRGRLLLHTFGAPAPTTIGDLATRAEVEPGLVTDKVRDYVKRGYLLHRRDGYELSPDKRTTVERWVEFQLTTLLRAGRLLFVPGGSPADSSLRSRLCYLCEAKSGAQSGTLWMGRTSGIAQNATTRVDLSITFPEHRSVLRLPSCPALTKVETQADEPTRTVISDVGYRAAALSQDLVRGMIRAIDDEIPFAREDQVRIYTSQGHFEGPSGTQYVYRFTIDHFDGDTESRPVLPDDSPIQVQMRRDSYRGILVGQNPGELLIALDDDLGRGSIGAAVIISSPADLLEAMKIAIRKGEGSSSPMALAVFNEASARVVKLPSSKVPIPLDDLNPEQQIAVRLSLESQVAFIWGPPGTGKTHTLGQIIRGLRAQGKRILLLAHTNVAVDTLLMSAVRRLQNTPEYLQGRVLRYGVAQRSDLKQINEVLPEKVAERQNPTLAKRRTELEVRKAALDKQLAQLKVQPAGPRRDQEIRRVEDDTQTIAREILAIRRKLTEFGEQLISQASVVACTLTKAYMASLLETQAFDAVIIDEASMAPLPSVWLAARKAQHQMILVGDFRQLGPIAKADTPAVNKWLRRDIFEVAGIQEAVQQGKDDPRLVMLREQRRMHPAISAVPNKVVYGGKLRDHFSEAHFAPIVNLRPLSGVSVAMVNTRGLLPWNFFTETGSRFNLQSALLSLRLAGEALADGVPTVGIITPFAAQARLLRRLIKDAGWKSDRVAAATVHRFQGDERDVIVFDAVVDQPSFRLGRLLEGDQDSNASRLINVAWTRAKAKLLFVGNVPHLKAAIVKEHGLSPFFWEARSAGDHDGTVHISNDALTPAQYLPEFLLDIGTARKAVVHSPILPDPLADELLRIHRRGADVTLVVGSYSSALDVLEKSGIRIGFSDRCSFLSWLDDEIVWFGRSTPDGTGYYFRQRWRATARDLWNLTGMDGLLQEASTPTQRMAQRLSWRGGPKCEKCGMTMRVRFGEYGFYRMCPCQPRASKAPVSAAEVALVAAEVGVRCPTHGSTMIVVGRGTRMVCRMCGFNHYLER